GSSLQCYNCTLQLSNSNCKTKMDCKDKEMCKTDVIRVKGLFSIISKSCDSSCQSLYQDFSLLCNINAAGNVRYSYGMAAGIAASVLWPFLNNR
ncbi:Prostate stem cell antigen, partial [Eurypyga helias]